MGEQTNSLNLKLTFLIKITYVTLFSLELSYYVELCLVFIFT